MARDNRATRRKAGKVAAALMTPTLPGKMVWGVRVHADLWVSAHRHGPPHRWHQWWQRVLLGWRWEQRAL